LSRSAALNEAKAPAARNNNTYMPA